MDDDTVRRTLTGMKGIGPWTAEIYLLLALRRPDAWPLHDIALAGAIQQVKQLPARPTPSEMDAIGAAWRPWRAVAARLLWHHYLSQRAPGTDFRNL
jgi:DNA-3-methyladenine glycosylase II